jgi:hypothetical protein
VFLIHSPGRTETSKLAAVERRTANVPADELDTASSGSVVRPTAARVVKRALGRGLCLEALQRLGLSIEGLEHRE